MPSRFILHGACALLLAVVSCRGGPAEHGDSSGTAAPLPPRAPGGDSVSDPRVPLSLRLTVPAEVRVGATVTFVVRVANPATIPVDAYLRGRDITVDVVVSRADGSVAWRSLEGTPIQSILQLRTFAAGEVVELRETWDQRDDGGRPVGAGDYTVQATLLTEERPGLASEPMPLRIR